MWMYFVLIILAETASQDVSKKHAKRRYVCPPDFLRLTNNCYFFSKNMATWQNAYWECQDRHSDLATIVNGNQDKILRNFLNRDALAPLERWLGGTYDWEQMVWKWGATGKLVNYQGFSRMKPADKESLRWHCIILDPVMQYKWSSRSCLQDKHYICQTKIKKVAQKGRRKLQRQYSVTKLNKLNEIPVPELPEDNRINGYDRRVNKTSWSGNIRYDDNELSNVAFARRNGTTTVKRRRGKGRGRKNKKRNRRKNQRKDLEGPLHLINGTSYSVPMPKHGKNRVNRKRRNKSKEDKDTSIENIKSKTYFNDITINPLHPKIIIEELSYN